MVTAVGRVSLRRQLTPPKPRRVQPRWTARCCRDHLYGSRDARPPLLPSTAGGITARERCFVEVSWDVSCTRPCWGRMKGLLTLSLSFEHSSAGRKCPTSEANLGLLTESQTWLLPMSANFWSLCGAALLGVRLRHASRSNSRAPSRQVTQSERCPGQLCCSMHH